MSGWGKRLRRVGPGALITAAFIGPGTVTTCTRAGSGFGFALAWAVVVATLAALVLQEMTGRLGAMTGRDLATHLRERSRTPVLRVVVGFLVIGAIGFGCAAFEGGNLAGGAMGLRLLFETSETRSVLVIAVLALYLLLRGGYRHLERVLTVLVAAMGVAFLATAVLAAPDWGAVLGGTFTPALPDGSALLVLGLLGTTVVPYNLFLHSRAVTQRGEIGESRLAETRFDLLLCVPLGGLVSLAIVVSSAVAFADVPGEVVSAGDLGRQLEPLLGEHAKALFGFGLFAAGLTSALTAPVAASFAVCGILGRPDDADRGFGRGISVAVLVLGASAALSGVSPSQVILAAQSLNGVLLPVSAGFLLWIMNDAGVLGSRRNGRLTNALGATVVALAVFLSARALYTSARAYGLFE